MRVYLAGPYSADNVIDVLKNIGRGEYFAAELFRMGYFPYCPWHDKDFVIKLWDHPLDVSQFQNAAMAWLEVSDCILVLPSYEGSKGTLAEIERAKELEIPVFYELQELEDYVEQLLLQQYNQNTAEEILKEIDK